MLFSSQAFILMFVPLVLGGFFIAGRIGPQAALGWLIGASLVFYGSDNAAHLPLLVGSILANLAVARRIAAHASAGRALAAAGWMRGGIVANLLVLGGFKYADFTADTVAAITGFAIPHPGLGLPLGISFFTFQQIMFLADSRAGGSRARPPVPLPYIGSIALFPHLIAGPLVRPREIMVQLASPTLGRPDADRLVSGAAIFLIGLAKKLVLADTFAGFANVGFAAAAGGASLTAVEAWYAALAFSLQIYFDFSGYSDMAIGLARMLGIDFPVNFASPYKATDISEFWHCWHITLSSFLRDFAYIPLGGNRDGEWWRARNVMATMLLGGLWHGAGWNFVLWGALHGAYLIVHRQFARAVPAPSGRARHLARRAGQALTLLAVVVAWVPFRAGSLRATGSVLAGMAGWHGVALPQLVLGLLPGLDGLVTSVPVLRYLGDARTLSLPEVSVCLAIGWAIVLFAPNTQQLTERQRRLTLAGSFAFTAQALFFAPSVAPFVYFRF